MTDVKYYRRDGLQWPLTPEQLQSVNAEVDAIYRALNDARSTIDSAVGVVAGTYGDATDIPQLTVNAQGFVTSIVNVPIGSALTGVNDTNVTLTLGGTPATALVRATSLTLGWIGTLAAGRLNANVVQGVVNDTNVTGAIATQVLTLGWTGTLAAARLNANVVQSVVNDTNVTGSIAAQALTLGWTGTLAIARGGTGAATLAGAGIVTGSGTTGKLPKWTTGASGILGDSVVVESSGFIGIGVTPLSALHVKRDGGAAVSVGTGDQLRIDSGVSGHVAELHLTDNVTSDGILTFVPSATAASRYLNLTTRSTLGDFAVFGDAGVAIGSTTSPGAGNLSLKGKLTTYANVATVGWGVPAIVGGARITGQTANATIATFTPGADATLVIYGGGATTSGTWQSNITVTWTDADLGTAQSTNIFVITTGATIAGVTAIRVKASTVVTLKTVNTAGAGTYNAEGYIMQLA